MQTTIKIPYEWKTFLTCELFRRFTAMQLITPYRMKKHDFHLPFASSYFAVWSKILALTLLEWSLPGVWHVSMALMNTRLLTSRLLCSLSTYAILSLYLSPSPSPPPIFQYLYFSFDGKRLYSLHRLHGISIACLSLIHPALLVTQGKIKSWAWKYCPPWSWCSFRYGSGMLHSTFVCLWK